jgi:chromosome segregation ATPase
MNEGQEPQGGQEPEGTKDTTIADLKSALAVISELRKENAAVRVTNKQLTASQEKLIKLEQQQKELEEAEALKKGEYEKILANNKQELSRLKELEEEIKVYKAKEQEEIKELKSKLPKALQDKFKDNANIEEIKAIVEFTNNGVANNSIASGMPADKTQTGAFNGMSGDQIIELARANPQLYNQLCKQYEQMKV